MHQILPEQEFLFLARRTGRLDAFLLKGGLACDVLPQPLNVSTLPPKMKADRVFLFGQQLSFRGCPLSTSMAGKMPSTRNLAASTPQQLLFSMSKVPTNCCAKEGCTAFPHVQNPKVSLSLCQSSSGWELVDGGASPSAG